METERLSLHLVHDDDDLRITRTAGESDCLVVSFSGIGVFGSAVQPEEFIMTATDGGRHPALYIMDKRRSWMNAPGLLEKIVQTIEAEAVRVGAAKVCAMGNSMGGFMAMLTAYYTRINHVLACSPQYSVDPSVNPDEWRWTEYTGQVETFLHPTLADRLTERTQYTVLSGGHQREAPQLNAFPRHPAITHYVHPRVAHGIGRYLKKTSVQRQVAQAVFEGRRRRTRIILKSVGFRARGLDQVAA